MTLNSRLRTVYGLPTLLGLGLGLLLCFAIWFSIFNNSMAERLIFILMLIIGVIHLLEASYPIRMLDISLLPKSTIPPCFCGEEVLLEFEIKNLSNLSSNLWGKLPCKSLKSNANWVRVPPVSIGSGEPSSRTVALKFIFTTAGVRTISQEPSSPSFRVKSYDNSGLICFWRFFTLEYEFLVLPSPVDYGIGPRKGKVANENELDTLEEIFDPTRFKYTDPKLFQRTNRRYQRSYRSTQASGLLIYDWDDLIGLSLDQQAGQFSFWLKTIYFYQDKNMDVRINAPFMSTTTNLTLPNTETSTYGSASYLALHELKLNFLRWYHEQI